MWELRKEEVSMEPRFLLDPDSICYGCPNYKHIDDVDDSFSFDDIDENGGVCDCTEVCYEGSLNGYRMDD